MKFPRKFYLRKDEIQPDTAARNAIRHGLWQQGVETVDFMSPDEIKTFKDLSPEVGVAGYISDVFVALETIGAPRPPPIDYPEELKGFLGRNVYKTTLRNFLLDDRKEPLFIKPSNDHKLFTGLVWNNTRDQRYTMAPTPNKTEIWVSEVVEFVSEYRVFILDNEVLDCRRYKGDWSKAPHRLTVLMAVEAMEKVAPVAYCLDFGVTKKGETLLVEANDGFAMGPYGLAPPQYACMVASRWRQLAMSLPGKTNA